jgi:hypothetical protein
MYNFLIFFTLLAKIKNLRAWSGSEASNFSHFRCQIPVPGWDPDPTSGQVYHTDSPDVHAAAQVTAICKIHTSTRVIKRSVNEDRFGNLNNIFYLYSHIQ